MKVTFQCIDGRHYLHAEFGGAPESEFPKGLITADRLNPFAEEEFEPLKLDDGRWAFKSSNGYWLSAQQNGKLYANRTKVQGWESFELYIQSDGRFSLKTDHGKFVCAEGGGGREVIADRSAANAWESFLPSQRFWVVGGGGGGDIQPLPSGRLHVEDRYFVVGGQTYRPRWASALSILRRSASQREDLLSWLRSVGFDGVRVFAGALSWAGQTPDLARQELPGLLEMCRRLGLLVEVVPVTDSGVSGGYDVGSHTKAVVQICTQFENTIIEIANEPWHPTQAESVHNLEYLMALRRALPSYIPTSLGAPSVDEEPIPQPVADYITLHLDRGRDKWNMVRRVRELELVSQDFKKPVINNEPIGADELDGSQTGRQRLNDPSIFFCMGALNRLFEVGGVFHSQFGLQAEMPGPVQTDCATAFIRGWSSIQTIDRVAFYNARWANSPVVDADFDSGALVRAYSGVWGNRGAIVLVGLRGDPHLVVGNGWSVTGTIEEVSGCKILSVAR